MNQLFRLYVDRFLPYQGPRMGGATVAMETGPVVQGGGSQEKNKHYKTSEIAYEHAE